MCYRVARDFDDVDVVKQKEFGVTRVLEHFMPSYNVSITQKIPVIIPGSRTLTLFKWGLIPHWAKEESVGDKLGNARAESIDEKPSFRESFANKRCLVLVSGFFEWDSNKTPYYIKFKGKKIFALAGLWDSWMGDSREEIKSCTIITCEPNNFLKDIHNRMPVVLEEKDYEMWLLGKNTKKLKEILKPFSDDLTLGFEVNKAVNFAKNNYPDLLKPLKEIKEKQRTLDL